jgi:hypothetical protein
MEADMVSRRELAICLDELLEAEAAIFLASVPSASHLTDDRPLNAAYYIRHRIETIKRIRLTARTDALALVRMVEEDYEAARPWGRYVCEELDHDTMFLGDLQKHGVTAAVVDATPLYAATRDMIDYIERNIAARGSIAAVAYSVFVEWNSARYSEPAVLKAAATFSSEHIAGSHSHLAIDQDEDHYDVMVDITHRLLRGGEPGEILFPLIRDIAALFRRYFEELHRDTLERAVAA